MDIHMSAWSKTTKARPAPKEHENPVGTSLTHHCIGIMVKLHPENYVSTCTTGLSKLNIEDNGQTSCCQCWK